MPSHQPSPFIEVAAKPSTSMARHAAKTIRFSPTPRPKSAFLARLGPANHRATVIISLPSVVSGLPIVIISLPTAAFGLPEVISGGGIVPLSQPNVALVAPNRAFGPLIVPFAALNRAFTRH